MTKNIQIHIKMQVDIVERVPIKVKSGYRAKKIWNKCLDKCYNSSKC